MTGTGPASRMASRAGSAALPAARVRRLRAVVVTALAALFGGAAVAHVVYLDAFAAIVPPAVAFPRAVVLLTGAIELALAAAILPRRTRPVAGWLLAAYCLAVVPANIHMAATPGLRAGLPEWLLWVRVALQVPLIALIVWATRVPPDRADGSGATAERG